MKAGASGQTIAHLAPDNHTLLSERDVVAARRLAVSSLSTTSHPNFTGPKPLLKCHQTATSSTFDTLHQLCLFHQHLAPNLSGLGSNLN